MSDINTFIQNMGYQMDDTQTRQFCELLEKYREMQLQNESNESNESGGLGGKLSAGIGARELDLLVQFKQTISRDERVVSRCRSCGQEVGVKSCPVCHLQVSSNCCALCCIKCASRCMTGPCPGCDKELPTECCRLPIGMDLFSMRQAWCCPMLPGKGQQASCSCCGGADTLPALRALFQDPHGSPESGFAVSARGHFLPDAVTSSFHVETKRLREHLTFGASSFDWCGVSPTDDIASRLVLCKDRAAIRWPVKLHKNDSEQKDMKNDGAEQQISNLVQPRLTALMKYSQTFSAQPGQVVSFQEALNAVKEENEVIKEINAALVGKDMQLKKRDYIPLYPPRNPGPVKYYKTDAKTGAMQENEKNKADHPIMIPALEQIALVDLVSFANHHGYATFALQYATAPLRNKTEVQKLHDKRDAIIKLFTNSGPSKLETKLLGLLNKFAKRAGYTAGDSMGNKLKGQYDNLLYYWLQSLHMEVWDSNTNSESTAQSLVAPHNHQASGNSVIHHSFTTPASREHLQTYGFVDYKLQLDEYEEAHKDWDEKGHYRPEIDKSDGVLTAKTVFDYFMMHHLEDVAVLCISDEKWEKIKKEEDLNKRLVDDIEKERECISTYGSPESKEGAGKASWQTQCIFTGDDFSAIVENHFSGKYKTLYPCGQRPNIVGVSKSELRRQLEEQLRADFKKNKRKHAANAAQEQQEYGDGRQMLAEKALNCLFVQKEEGKSYFDFGEGGKKRVKDFFKSVFEDVLQPQKTLANTMQVQLRCVPTDKKLLTMEDKDNGQKKDNNQNENKSHTKLGWGDAQISVLARKVMPVLLSAVDHKYQEVVTQDAFDGLNKTAGIGATDKHTKLK